MKNGEWRLGRKQCQSILGLVWRENIYFSISPEGVQTQVSLSLITCYDISIFFLYLMRKQGQDKIAKLTLLSACQQHYYHLVFSNVILWVPDIFLVFVFKSYLSTEFTGRGRILTKLCTIIVSRSGHLKKCFCLLGLNCPGG